MFATIRSYVLDAQNQMVKLIRAQVNNIARQEKLAKQLASAFAILENAVIP
jgi:anti-sigma regulatory factor (Ser/Thr protein kinase)